jgi:hypothetical protein
MFKPSRPKPPLQLRQAALAAYLGGRPASGLPQAAPGRLQASGLGARLFLRLFRRST